MRIITVVISAVAITFCSFAAVVADLEASPPALPSHKQLTAGLNLNESFMAIASDD